MRLLSITCASLLLAFLFSAPAVLALDPPPPAEHAILGLYTTPGFDGTTANWVAAAPGETVTIYAVLSYSVFGGVGGVEFTVATDPPGAFGTILALGDTELDDSAVMITTAPDYVIGYGLPLASYTGHRVVLAQEFTVLSSAPVLLMLQPYSDPTLPGVMAYDDWFNPADVRAMIPNSDGHSHDLPVFGVNQEIVATEGATWSTIKATFE